MHTLVLIGWFVLACLSTIRAKRYYDLKKQEFDIDYVNVPFAVIHCLTFWYIFAILIWAY